MKIGLIVPANLKYSPYVKYYTDILKAEGVCFRVMVWDKAGMKEDADLTFSFRSSDFDRKRIMLGHYLFSQRCKRFIRREKIDHLIIFTIAPLFFLGYNFLKHYQGRIIMDIRDDSPFRRQFPQKLLKISELAGLLVVSSPFYAEWFQRESILCHNADQSMIAKYASSYGKERIDLPASIVFAGMMIEEKTNIQVISELTNSDDYRLIFIGRNIGGTETLKQYVQENDIRNVSFEGEFQKEDIVDIYRRKADLVNILREKTMINRNALPNKMYDAVVSGIPIAVYDHNEAIANYVKQYSLGIVLDEQKDIKDQLYQYIHAFNPILYKSGRDTFIQQIQNDWKLFENKLTEFCKG